MLKNTLVSPVWSPAGYSLLTAGSKLLADAAGDPLRWPTEREARDYALAQGYKIAGGGVVPPVPSNMES